MITIKTEREIYKKEAYANMACMGHDDTMLAFEP